MIHTSFFALLCGAATGIVVSNILYYPRILGIIWSRQLTNYIKDPQKAMKRGDKLYGLFYLYSFIISLTMGEFVYYANQLFEGNKIIIGMLTGFVVWIGIVTPIQFLDYEGEGKPFKLTLITLVNQFFSLIAMGAVLGLLMNKNI